MARRLGYGLGGLIIFFGVLLMLAMLIGKMRTFPPLYAATGYNRSYTPSIVDAQTGFVYRCQQFIVPTPIPTEIRIPAPDGRHVAVLEYQYDARFFNSSYDLSLEDTDGNITHVTGYVSEKTVRWSPDSEWIFFSAVEGDQNYTFYRVNIDTLERQRVVDNAGGIYCAGDGSACVIPLFQRQAQTQLWVRAVVHWVDMTNGNAYELVSNQYGGLEYRWLPDAPVLVYNIPSDDRADGQRLYMLDARDGQSRELAHLPAIARVSVSAFIPSPDGTRLAVRGFDSQSGDAIAFVSLVDDTPPVMADMDGYYSGGEGDLVWSPDSTQVVLSAYMDGGVLAANLYGLNATTGERLQLTHFTDGVQAIVINGAWSSDSTWLVFSLMESFYAPIDLYRVRADGSGLYRIPATLDLYYPPRWLTDSTNRCTPPR